MKKLLVAFITSILPVSVLMFSIQTKRAMSMWKELRHPKCLSVTATKRLEATSKKIKINA